MNYPVPPSYSWTPCQIKMSLSLNTWADQSWNKRGLILFLHSYRFKKHSMLVIGNHGTTILETGFSSIKLAVETMDIFSDLYPHASTRTSKTPACTAHQPCLLYQSMSHNAIIWTEAAEIRKSCEHRWICIASRVIFPQSSHQCASPHDRVTFYISMLMWWAFAGPGSLISRMSLHALATSRPQCVSARNLLPEESWQHTSLTRSSLAATEMLENAKGAYCKTVLCYKTHNLMTT